MEAITIRIYASDSEGGYMYDIYNEDQVFTDADSVDGGLCTTTMLNALGMAVSQAEDLIKRVKGEECAGCWQTITGTAISSTFDENTKLCVDCKAREKQEGDFIAER